ncbi:MAG: hypothetical protein AAF490_23715 [Chloroflexota bacterium]
MPDQALTLLTTHLPDTHLALFIHRLTQWLLTDHNEQEEMAAFTESRAKALLRATNVIDDPTLKDFFQRLESETAVRVALHTLLNETELASNDEIVALAATSGSGDSTIDESQISYLALAIAAYAYQRGYPLAQLDPASPPAEFSPAGQIIKRAGYWMRQQIQRSATERDKLAKKLAYKGTSSTPATPSLDTMTEQPAAAPVPPHYRPPIPVDYPEVSNETIQINSDPVEQAPPSVGITAVPVGASITITEDDLVTPPAPPITMPPIRITEEQVATTSQRIQRQVIEPAVSNASSFATAVRRQWSNSRERMTTTKLRVMVHEYPDGPAMYGLQVRITCRGVRSHVAGTTNRDGVFVAELPVRVQSGLTYDVQVNWPRDYGGEKERKSITLNADRTHFELPFYLKHNA